MFEEFSYGDKTRKTDGMNCFHVTLFKKNKKISGWKSRYVTAVMVSRQKS